MCWPCFHAGDNWFKVQTPALLISPMFLVCLMLCLMTDKSISLWKIFVCFYCCSCFSWIMFIVNNVILLLINSSTIVCTCWQLGKLASVYIILSDHVWTKHLCVLFPVKTASLMTVWRQGLQLSFHLNIPITTFYAWQTAPFDVSAVKWLFLVLMYGI